MNKKSVFSSLYSYQAVAFPEGLVSCQDGPSKGVHTYINHGIVSFSAQVYMLSLKQMNMNFLLYDYYYYIFPNIESGCRYLVLLLFY